MRKIKELEQKIEQLDKLYEKKIYNLYEKFDSFYKQTEKIIDNIKEGIRLQKGFCSEIADKVNKQEKILQEHEKNLTEAVYPFILENLAKDLYNELKGLADLLVIFTEEPKKTAKSVKKGTEKPAKNVDKKTTKKTKKENK